MKRNLNLPNALTLLRIFMIPAVFVTYYRLPDQRWISLVIYLAACFTDFWDGYLARKWNQVTDFGKLCDPLADKLITLTVLYCLADTGYTYWFVFYAMLAKEIIMVLASAFLLTKKVVVKANYWGKSATCAFILAIAISFPWHNAAWLFTAGRVLIVCALALAVAAFVQYGWQMVKNPPKD